MVLSKQGMGLESRLPRGMLWRQAAWQEAFVQDYDMTESRIRSARLVGFSQCVDDEVGGAELVVEVGVACELLF